jgi:hypothetical protein
MLVRPFGGVGNLIGESGGRENLCQQWVGIERDGLHQAIQIGRSKSRRRLGKTDGRYGNCE